MSTVTWVSRGLTSHSTLYRSFRGQFLQARWPNQQRQSTERSQLAALLCPHLLFITSLNHKRSSKFFTAGTSIKSATKYMYRLPPHLRYVAALPWEVRSPDGDPGSLSQLQTATNLPISYAFIFAKCNALWLSK